MVVGVPMMMVRGRRRTPVVRDLGKDLVVLPVGQKTRHGVPGEAGVDVAAVLSAAECAAIPQPVSHDDGRRGVHRVDRLVPAPLREVTGPAGMVQGMPDMPGSREAVHPTPIAMGYEIADQ